MDAVAGILVAGRDVQFDLEITSNQHRPLLQRVNWTRKWSVIPQPRCHRVLLNPGRKYDETVEA